MISHPVFLSARYCEDDWRVCFEAETCICCVLEDEKPDYSQHTIKDCPHVCRECLPLPDSKALCARIIAYNSNIGCEFAAIRRLLHCKEMHDVILKKTP